MIYEFLEDGKMQIIRRTDNEGKVRFIPLDPRNSDYAEYLRYTEWVEAGNNPEEFWSQSEDFLDTSVPEQPKEEGEG